MQDQIEEGYVAFVSGVSTGIGAVRQVAPDGRPELIIYVENAGDFVVPIDAVEAVAAIIDRVRTSTNSGTIYLT